MYKCIILFAFFIVIGATLTLGAHLRWTQARYSSYQSVHDDSKAGAKDAASPIPGAKYFWRETYTVAYSQGNWPFVIAKESPHHRDLMWTVEH